MEFQPARTIVCLALVVTASASAPAGTAPPEQPAPLRAPLEFEAAKWAVEEGAFAKTLALPGPEAPGLRTARYAEALRLAARLEGEGLLQETAEPSPSVAEGSGRTLVTTLCVACHTLGRVMSARRTEEGWRNTIERHDLPQGQISDDEIEIIVAYLTRQFGVEPAGTETPADLQGDWQFSFQGSAGPHSFPFRSRYECEEARSRGLQSARQKLSRYGDGSGDAQMERQIPRLRRVLETTTPCHPVEE